MEDSSEQPHSVADAIHWRVPGPPLSDYVESLWHYNEHRAGRWFERVLPKGMIVLVINLVDGPLRRYDARDDALFERLPGAMAWGIQPRSFRIDTVSRESYIGVDFKPGRAFPFLGAQAHELLGDGVSLELLWGRDARELRERLSESGSPGERFSILERALLERLSAAAGPHPAVATALELWLRAPSAPIGPVAAAAGLSRRRFIELFRREVGAPPKLFCRILRFRGAVDRLTAACDAAGTDQALRSGYYDQSHFIRDFQEFTGLTPSAYRELRNPRPHPTQSSGL